ncbi:MAG TPA: phospholipase D family protein [Burkholderiaceae bacterium]|nr:phospholipase D family protein [Burkholderiaceae bacterium]
MLLASCSSLPPNVSRTPSSALADASDTALGRLVASAVPATNQPSADSGFRLLIRSDVAYGSRMAMIDAAQKTLDLQYYAIHYDSSTEALLEQLRQAARRGVRVRILLDDFNATGRNIEVLRLDLEPGIEIRMFNPVTGSRRSQTGRMLGSLFDFQRIQQRMHNKVFIADNALAVTGGRNLGDEYFGQGQNNNFLDLDVLAAGRIVRELSRSFDRYWNHELAYPVQALLTPGEKEMFSRPQSAAPAPSPASAPATSAEMTTQPATNAAAGQAPQAVAGAAGVADDIRAGKLELVWAPSALLVDQPSKIAPDDTADPADMDETVVEGLLQMIQQARKELLIVSPYFVPGDRMMQTFTALRQRGIRIRVLTNSLASNDAPLAHVGYARYRVALLKAGVELYEMRSQGTTQRRLFGSAPASRASLHSKTVVMDERLLAIGSMNLDLRSALQNTEVSLVIRSATLSRSMAQSIEQTLNDSYRLEWVVGKLLWHAPKDEKNPALAIRSSEPEAGFGLQLMLKLIGPFAPSEML